MGAYQDIMGDLHNLFGRVNEVHVFLDPDEPAGYYVEEIIEGNTIVQALASVQYDENELKRQMKAQMDAAIKSDRMKPSEAMRLLDDYERGLKEYTYLLIVCVQTAKAEWLKSFGAIPPLVATGLLLYGLWQIGYFQKQERPWRNALDRAKLLALINFGLSPFLYWWNKVPGNTFFAAVVIVLAISALWFLSTLNVVLCRLGAMLPDETLRQETRQFTNLNRLLVLIALLLTLVLVAISQLQILPAEIANLMELWERQSRSGWFVLNVLPVALLVLLPLAMTMALLWKTKEVILDNVFGAQR
jgi:hypothetical protein